MITKEMHEMRQTMKVLVDNFMKSNRTVFVQHLENTIETNFSQSESNGTYSVLDQGANMTVMGRIWFESYLKNKGLAKAQIKTKDTNKIF